METKYIIEKVDISGLKPYITPIANARTLRGAKRLVRKHNRLSCAFDLVYYKYRILEEA